MLWIKWNRFLQLNRILANIFSQMELYELGVDHIGSSKYAWASGYGPIAKNINDIPFLKDASDIFKQNRIKSWEINDDLPGITLDSYGKEWPDVLGCGQGAPSAFFNEKILIDLRDANIPYLRATEMPLMEPYPKKLRVTPPPVYYVLEGTLGLKVAWDAMGIPQGNDFSKGYPKPWPPNEWKVSLTSWSGLDLMSYHNWQMPMTLICTDRVVALAEAKKWTNIKFALLTTVD